MNKNIKYKMVFKYYEDEIFVYCSKYPEISSFYDPDVLVKDILKNQKKLIKEHRSYNNQLLKKKEYMVSIKRKD